MTLTKWDISKKKNYILVLSHRFQTELGYDFLEIHDGPNLLSPLVGSFNGTQVPQFLFSSSNFLYLLFTTDNSRSNAGFKILYESKSEMNTVELCICTCGHAFINTRYHPPYLSIYRSENAHYMNPYTDYVGKIYFWGKIFSQNVSDYPPSVCVWCQDTTSQ